MTGVRVRKTPVIPTCTSITQRLWVPGKFPGLNEIIEACGRRRGKWNGYMKMKSEWSEIIQNFAMAQRFQRVEAGYFTYLHRERNAARDPGNFAAGAQKVMEDALQEIKLLENDGQKNVLAFHHHWVVDNDVQGVSLFVSGRLLSKDEAIRLDGEIRSRK